MYVTGLECMHCGREFPPSQMFEGCPACRREDFTANLRVRYDRRKQARVLGRRVLEKAHSPGLLRYMPLLPVDADHPFDALRAGGTPLIACPGLAGTLGLKELYVKDESRNPTGSEKDRRASVGANVAAHFGARGLVAAGGNMGAAAAAAGARCGLPVVSVETTFESPVALLQVRAYGGLSVPLASYEARCAVMKQCVDVLGFQPLSSFTPFPTGDPYSQEGEKTVAYEICESMGWRAPDKVLVAVGQGFALSGIWSGFVDFQELGLIDSLPAMVGVESLAGRALSATRVCGPAPSETLLDGSIARHACSSRAAYKGLRAIEDSGGFSVAVAEEDILAQAIALAREDGILPSTTSATTVAALRGLVDAGLVKSSDRVVCVITASGLKDVDVLERGVQPMPGPVAADLPNLRRLAEERGIQLPGGG